MADLSLRLRLRQGPVSSLRPKNPVKVLPWQVVELVDINVIRPQVAQADFHVLLHARVVSGHGLGSQDEFVPPPLQGRAQVFLRHGIASGGVDIVHAAFLQRVHHRFGVGGVGPLDGDSAEGDGGAVQAGAAQLYVVHGLLPPYMIFRSVDCFQIKRTRSRPGPWRRRSGTPLPAPPTRCAPWRCKSWRARRRRCQWNGCAPAGSA